MSRTLTSVAAGILMLATAVLLPSTALAEDNWTYWGDGVSPGTGERSVSFDDGGISPAVCTLIFRVKRYPDLPTGPGWLEPIADVTCNANPGKVAEIQIIIYANYRINAKQSGARTNTLSAQGRYDGGRGRVCFGAQGIKNGSYTGAGQVDICGVW